MVIAGGCHCGNTQLRLDWPDLSPNIPARACSCTFCVKHGGAWTSNPAARLEVQIRDPTLLTEYRQGTQTASFHVCAQCGVVPFVTSRIGDQLHAVVNVNTLDGLDPARLQRTNMDFDDETVEVRLSRRARNWIADVRLTSAAV